jgi:hypothetical protein
MPLLIAADLPSGEGSDNHRKTAYRTERVRFEPSGVFADIPTFAEMPSTEAARYVLTRDGSR